MERKCPICFGENLIDLVYHQGVYRCSDCSHLFRSDDTSFDYKFYEENDYWYKDPEWGRFMKTYFAFFEDYICTNGIYPSLEIGAADGSFLQHIYNLQQNNTPGEPQIYYNELVDILLPNLQDKIPKRRRLIGPMEKISSMTKIKFQNVFLIEVMEHLKHPFQVFAILNNITKEDSRIFIATDNGDHLNAVDMMFHHREHLNIFSQKSMNRLLSYFPSFQILLYWNSPVGKSYIVLEKK